MTCDYARAIFGVALLFAALTATTFATALI